MYLIRTYYAKVVQQYICNDQIVTIYLFERVCNEYTGYGIPPKDKIIFGENFACNIIIVPI